MNVPNKAFTRKKKIRGKPDVLDGRVKYEIKLLMDSKLNAFRQSKKGFLSINLGKI